METYLGDMVIKNQEKESHVKDLWIMFEHIRRYNMRLNPKKCTFEIQRNKFLRFMITERRIEINPNKYN